MAISVHINHNMLLFAFSEWNCLLSFQLSRFLCLVIWYIFLVTLSYLASLKWVTEKTHFLIVFVQFFLSFRCLNKKTKINNTLQARKIFPLHLPHIKRPTIFYTCVQYVIQLCSRFLITKPNGIVKTYLQLHRFWHHMLTSIQDTHTEKERS